LPKSIKARANKVRIPREKQSSSAFFLSLRPKFLDWQPPTQEEHAMAAKDRRRAKEAESERIITLGKIRQTERSSIRKSAQVEALSKKRSK